MVSMASQILLCFARRARMKSLLAILACGVAFCILRFLEGMGYGIPDTTKIHCLFGLQLLLGLTILIMAAGIERSNSGFPSRMFVLPAMTRFLVFAQMLSGMLLGVLVYLAVAGMAWTILGAKWPLLGPSFFVAVFLASNMAILWFGPELSIVKAPPAILIWAALLVWLGKRYGIDSMPIHPLKLWTHVTLVEFLTMALLGVGAYGIALAGVSMDRRGDSPEFKKGTEWLEKDILVGSLGGGRGFSGPTAAQIWFEGRERGHLFPAANALIQLIVLVACICGLLDGTGMAYLLVATALLPLGCPFFAGLLTGACGSARGSSQVDSFRAIRPMSTQALANVMLLSGGLSVLYTWLIWLVSFALLTMYAYVTGRSEAFFAVMSGYPEMIGLGWMLFMGFWVLVLSWTGMASTASTAMTGKPWVFWLPSAGALAIGLAILYCHAQGMLAPSHYIVLIETAIWALGLWCFSGTILAFYFARRKRLVSDRTIRWAVLSWVTLCTVAGYAGWQLYIAMVEKSELPLGLGLDYALVIAVAGFLMLPVAPLATAPLALAWNRSH